MVRIVKSGQSIGLPGARIPTFGTLGAAVIDSDGHAYALTCSHVLAAPENGNALNANVESPATLAQTPGSQVIGKVFSWVELGQGDNFADAALALADPSILLSNLDLGIAASARLMHGETSDFFAYYGHVAQVHTVRGKLAGNIGHVYNHKIFTAEQRSYSFSSVLAYDAMDGPFLPGDSGSAVTEDSTNEFLGIHFAADNNGQTGYCILSCNIWQNFQDLALQLMP